MVNHEPKGQGVQIDLVGMHIKLLRQLAQGLVTLERPQIPLYTTSPQTTER